MWPIKSPSAATKDLLYHQVEVVTSQNIRKTGWVYTIDPISHSVVLYETDDIEKPKLTLIFGHFIQDINTLQDPTEEIRLIFNGLFLKENECFYSKAELEERQMRLKAWLEKNRLPVKADGDKLKISEALDILPPYTKRSCQSRNQIILSRVQAIIEAMPET